MTTASVRTLAMALAASGLAISGPASAMPQVHAGADAVYGQITYRDHDEWDRHDRGRHLGWYKHHRDHDDEDDDDDGYRRYRSGYYGGGYRQQAYYGEPVYANTRVWQGNNGQAFCRKSDGTTGLIIGGAAGALIGQRLAGYRGDRTLGAILGAAGGALLGKRLDNGIVCR